MYQEFFGLSGKPFQLSPDARFFYPSKEHSRALSFLEYGLNQADGFIVITGDVGTGKSTLVQTLLGNLNPKDIVVANIVTTQVDADDLLSLVAANFGLRLSSSSKALMLRDLERLFIQRAREGKRALLIVDEAQNLPVSSVEELRMLSNFQYGGKPLLQVFLLGQEEFRGTLLSAGFEQLRQRVIATYHLNPLEPDDTRIYIEHRLSRVGWQQDPALSDDAFEAIYEFTSGVPRRINNLCDRLMLFAYLEETHSIDAAMVQTVAEEIGIEFLGGNPDKPESDTHSTPEKIFDEPSQPLETMAKIMFDKANVQQRLASLERGLDSLGHGLKEELGDIRVLLSQLAEGIESLQAKPLEEEGDLADPNGSSDSAKVSKVDRKRAS